MNNKATHFAIAMTVSACILGGCVGKEESVTLPPPNQTSTAATKGSALGTEVQGEHYAIKLVADPAEPKVGKVKFTANVMHHGQPTDGAKVNLETTMPAMGHDGPKTELKSAGGGEYSGELDLGMAGEFSATVSVDQEGHTGEAQFSFVVKQ